MGESSCKSGNEVADLSAKTATVLPVFKNVPLSQAHIKPQIKQEILLNWQQNWSSAKTARYTFQIFNKVNFDVKLHHKILFYFATNQGSFPAFLFKIGKSSTPGANMAMLSTFYHKAAPSCQSKLRKGLQNRFKIILLESAVRLTPSGF